VPKEYVKRPSRTELLKNPIIHKKDPVVDRVGLADKVLKKANEDRKKRDVSESSSSESSNSDSDSGSSVSSKSSTVKRRKVDISKK
jgi:hypothetical protein